MKTQGYLLIFICFLPLLFFRDFTPNNELKYLSIANEALRDGHFLTFWNHGLPYADKPPFYFWIIMLGKWLLGEHYMLFIGLFSLLPALGILRIMDRWTQPLLAPEFRSTAPLLLITTALFTGAAVVIRMDMLMCLFITLALYTFYRLYTNTGRKYDPWLLPVWIFLALFTKGPVGLLIPLLSIPAFLLTEKRIREFPKYLGIKQWGILLGLSLLWFAGVYAEGGKDYLHNLLFHQTINRAVDSFHHKAPFWYYLQTMWYALAPWILLYLGLIIYGLRKHRAEHSMQKFFLTIIAVTLTALSVFSSKLDIYLLPVYPFVVYLGFLLTGPQDLWRLRPAVILPAVLLFCSFPAIFIVRHLVSSPVLGSPYIPFIASVLTIGSAFCLYLIFRKRMVRATNTLSITILLTILTGGVAVSDMNPYIGFKELCQKAQIIAQETGIENFHYYKFRSGENMDAYLKKEIDKVDLPELSLLAKQQNFILFVKQKELKKNADLQKITNNRIYYTVGDYNIIVFQFNE